MFTTHVNGVDIAYETQGDPHNPPILLIVGLGMQLVAWPDSFCDGLVQRGFYVIRFDNRDSGLSTILRHLGKPNTLFAMIKLALGRPIFSGYSLDDMAADAVGVLDALHIEKAHVLGVSMGGMIAQIVAERYPQRLLSLTSIMSTSGRRGLPGPTLEARRALLSRPPNAKDLPAVINHLVWTMEVIGSPAYPTPHAILYERVTHSVRRSLEPLGTARQLLAVAASGDRSALLKRIQAPTLVIHGRADPLIPIACGRDTAQLIPNAVMHEIEGMGHDLPDALSEQLCDLIAEHCYAAVKSNLVDA